MLDSRSSRSARSWTTDVASAEPSGSSPVIRSRPPQFRSGRRSRRASASWLISRARSMSSSAWAISAASSSRCSEVSDCIIRSAAAARRARESTSSSRSSGLSGKALPYFAMNSANRWLVSSPRASASSIAFRSASRFFIRATAAGSGFSSASLSPRNCVSRTSRRRRSPIWAYVWAASGERQSYSRSSRTARAGSLGSVSSAPSRNRASSDGSGNSAARSCPIAVSSSRRTSSSVPPSRPRSRSRARCSRTRRSRSSRPRGPFSVPCRSRRRSASCGLLPASTSSPSRSSAARTSYGGASGSGPPCQLPYR